MLVLHILSQQEGKFGRPALLPHTLPPSEGSSVFTQVRRCLRTSEGTREKGDKGGLEEKMNIYAAGWAWEKLKPSLPLGRDATAHAWVKVPKGTKEESFLLLKFNPGYSTVYMAVL